jgi:hypothetical protein
MEMALPEVKVVMPRRIGDTLAFSLRYGTRAILPRPGSRLLSCRTTTSDTPLRGTLRGLHYSPTLKDPDGAIEFYAESRCRARFAALHESRGENLINGLQNLLDDLKRGNGRLAIKITVNQHRTGTPLSPGLPP